MSRGYFYRATRYLSAILVDGSILVIQDFKTETKCQLKYAEVQLEYPVLCLKLLPTREIPRLR